MPHLNLKNLIYHLNKHNLNIHEIYLKCNNNMIGDALLIEHLYLNSLIQTLEKLQSLIEEKENSD